MWSVDNHMVLILSWCMSGTVRQDCNDGSYLVEDSAGCFEKIGREDIIADSDDAHIVIEVCHSIRHKSSSVNCILFAASL